MNKNFWDQITETLPTCVLDPNIDFGAYVSIDLSIHNKALNDVDVSSSTELGDYINSFIASENGKVGFGGYLETRAIYNRSTYFNSQNSEVDRNIHLGLDLWIADGTPIYAPIDGIIHSFKNNTNFGDYGPTIILEHDVQDQKFYTLYGHLSLESLDNLEVGQTVDKGEPIATLGDASVNGDYPPHLHFQIIRDLQGNFGDYPGVSSQKDLEFYKNNCPDPTILLGL
ncbi:MAG: peptidoglycan DD-metalloendopeptidase family protein [Psychroserpens sp.]|nr:peptidoglycan DD-metalloendopeptidase family protein [Psychroserpens sp.]